MNCGVTAEKWRANQDPAADRAGIARLTDVLSTIKARRILHISTVDVFASPHNADETTLPKLEGLHPYGAHRLALEDFIKDTFEHTQIIRLPGLFGEGLKKNVIFDLIHNNGVERINPAAVMQWYPMCRLTSDVETILEAELPLVHFTPEPLATAEILSEFFPAAQVSTAQTPAPHYDLRSVHASYFGGENGYMLARDEVLSEIGRFVGATVDA